MANADDEEAAHVYGPLSNHPHDDLAHLMGKLRYMKLLAERRERTEAQQRL